MVRYVNKTYIFIHVFPSMRVQVVPNRQVTKTSRSYKNDSTPLWFSPDTFNTIYNYTVSCVYTVLFLHILIYILNTHVDGVDPYCGVQIKTPNPVSTKGRESIQEILYNSI